MGYYNYRVTNRWTTMPYQVHERQYAVASAFLFQQPRTPPAYNHPLLREFWAVWDLDAFREAKNHWVKAFLNHAEMGLGFLAGALVLGIGLILLPFPPWNTVDRLTWPILAVFFLGMLPMKGVQSHYFAPIAALAFIRFMNGSATLWKWRPDARPIGPVMAMFAFEFVLLQSFVLLPTPPSVAAFGRNRASVEALLAAKPGKQLVIVRYQPNHFVHEEWVYNRADIDASQIVWARDMGADKDNKLVNYFRDRTTWLFEPDKDSSTLLPYSTAASVSPPGH